MLFARSIRENILLGLANPKEVAGEQIPSAGTLVAGVGCLVGWLLGRLVGWLVGLDARRPVVS